jgi:hypothetical protein
MTMPGKFPFDLPPIDLTRFCCGDQAAGGCSHDIAEHIGPAGECQGVFGCSCSRFRKHKANCVHNVSGEVVSG